MAAMMYLPGCVPLVLEPGEQSNSPKVGGPPYEWGGPPNRGMGWGLPSPRVVVDGAARAVMKLFQSDNSELSRSFRQDADSARCSRRSSHWRDYCRLVR